MLYSGKQFYNFLNIDHIWKNKTVWVLLVWYYRPNCVSPPNSYVEYLTPTVTLLGDRVFKKVIKLMKFIRVEPYSNRIDVLLRRKRDIRVHSFSQSTGKKAMETNPAGPFNLGLTTTRLGESKYLLFQLPFV